MRYHVKYISCDDMEIMASIEGKEVNRHSFYHPSMILFFVKKGSLILEVNDQTHITERGNFLLLNKFSNGFMQKTWTAEEGEALVYAIVFHQKFIEKVKKQLRIATNHPQQKIKAAYNLPPNHILIGLFDSIATYIDQEKDIDTHLVELKTLEAMMGVLRFHPECHALFHPKTLSQKVDLQLLVENNYMYNLPLSKLAEISGRSLSSFTRDFKAIYHESPHKWIRKRRLIKARELLLNTNRKPVEFYMELGFESLAHFSRAFKQEFGMTLTDFRKSNHSKIK